MSKNTKTNTSTKKKVSKKTTTKVATNPAPTRTTKTTYVAVSDNIYHDGTSYRVRVTRGGVRTSKNFSSKKKALEFRKTLV